MNTNRERMRQIFDQARRLAKAERAVFLDGLAAVDRPMREQVEEMLAALDEAGPFLSEPTQGIGAGLPTVDAGAISSSADTIATPLREGPGSRIGPYKILQLIGEGGFGSVFMAEQEKPVSRKVALKIIKLGMDTRQVVARFEQERQALAILNHPHIAKVFDAGATETGRPYFVMELCTGEPIDAYCDRNGLSIPDRLELFAQVCNAVQHAHTKGIIHRDIKPSNILISTQDGKPHAKVIDFGIAKATASKLTEKTLFTEHKALIGTPEYMSPEQAEGSLDIDTRTDVYSLGVLLYELLTGTTPFSSGELRSAAYAEIQRIIREVEPPKPSTRLSSNSDTLASIAASRRIEPKRLGMVVRGELDWIVMKALDKDRQRRYETANGLAMDVLRYLSGEAVVAAPPSSVYRLKKLIRRNKGPVAAGALVAAVLMLGLVGTSVGLVRAERARAGEAEQRKAAEAARAEAVTQETKAREQETEARKQAAVAKEQEAEAMKQAAVAEAVATFQTDMLSAVDPANLPKDSVTGETLKDRVTVVQAIESAIKKLDEGEGALKDQPLVEASVRDTIGKTLRGLGRSDEAETNLRESLALRRATLVAGHPDLVIGLNNLSMVLREQNKLAEAEPLAREALEIQRASLPANHRDIAVGLNNLAELLRNQNKLAEAETLQRQAVEIYRAALPAGHPDIGLGLNNLAVILQVQNKLSEAEPLIREAVAIRRAALPAGHPEIAFLLINLAQLLQAQKKLVEAEPLYREALEISRGALPAGHPDIATGLNSLASLLRDQKQLVEAEMLFREALEIRRTSLPAAHPDIAFCLNNLARVLQDQNKPAEAEPFYRESLAIFRAALPAGHPTLATILSNLALLQHELGQTTQARASWDEAIVILRQFSPNGAPNLARVLWRSGSARLENKEHAAALAELEEALSMGEKVLPADHPDLTKYRETLAKCKEAIAEQPQSTDK